MTMTESQRRRLTEFEGRCWHEPDGPYAVGIHRKGGGTVIQKCIKCNVLMSTTEQAYQQNPTYTDFNSVCPLLAKIVERGEWGSFRLWVKYEYDKVNWHGGVADCEAWMFANFTDPSHTAGLIAEWLERKEGA